MQMEIVTATSNPAPILLIHGAEGRGKTTLASKFPKPLALLLERGLPRGITIDAVGGLVDFEAVMAALREIYAEPGGYHTLVIDTVDALEAMLLEHVCRTNGWANIEKPSYGKGWIAADNEWRRFIRATDSIRNKNDMAVVLASHTAVERVDDPRAPTYTSYQPRLHKRARALVMDAADAVFFLAEDLRVVAEGEGFRERTRAAAGAGRFLFTEGRPAFAAKNRFGMPEKIPLPLNFDFSELARYWA
jgi:hypothetical protein